MVISPYPMMPQIYYNSRPKSIGNALRLAKIWWVRVCLVGCRRQCSLQALLDYWSLQLWESNTQKSMCLILESNAPRLLVLIPDSSVEVFGRLPHLQFTRDGEGKSPAAP